MDRLTKQLPSKAKRRSQRQTQGPNPVMAEAMRQALQKQAQGNVSTKPAETPQQPHSVFGEPPR